MQGTSCCLAFPSTHTNNCTVPTKTKHLSIQAMYWTLVMAPCLLWENNSSCKRRPDESKEGLAAQKRVQLQRRSLFPGARSIFLTCRKKGKASLVHPEEQVNEATPMAEDQGGRRGVPRPKWLSLGTFRKTDFLMEYYRSPPWHGWAFPHSTINSVRLFHSIRLRY